MERYWSLAVLGVVLRIISIGLFVLWIIFVFVQIVNAAQPLPQTRSTPNLPPITGDPNLDRSLLSTAYALTYVVIFLAYVGWPLLALIFYAAAQWIDLHIEFTVNSRAFASQPRMNIPALRAAQTKGRYYE
ncbi:MAG: hypothetical protein MUF38_01500 [Anaerolineae bacterium]|jgi:hypothetical protein|nr:hypothetical protein [Anaerolineae bacterium]